MQRTGGGCPFFQAHQHALGAHLVIVNHALLLSDIATGNRVLPDYDYLIIDEAHHLEEATTGALSYQITMPELERMLRELGGSNSGTLGWIVSTLEGVLSPEELGALHQLAKRITDSAFQFSQLANRFFDAINQFLFEQREGKPIGLYAHQVRILPATRGQPAWMTVEACWEDTQAILTSLLDLLANLYQLLSGMVDILPEESQDIYNQINSLYRRFKELSDQLDAFVFKPHADQIYWTEIQPDGRRLSLHSAPLHIGPLMERYLWHEKSSVILTSATLTAAGEFDYLRERLQAIDADELSLGSPFDYENAALLYIPNDIPEPADRHGYQRALDHCLIHLCRVSGGKTLVLFTSYSQLHSTAQAISGPLAKEGIIVFEHGDGASPHSLLENFRTSDKAVLLGTRAFWEGIDVPGEALSILAIAKLPFDVPSDPIVAARSETFEDSFYQYSLPEAILRFRQGFGRLIRSQSDRGVVTILDKRVLTKRYGRAFIESLPPCTVQVGPLADLPRSAANWLNL
jgi:DNA polymerase-3 subunit epsilon/ATP-dependent DNA helicase DinG